MEQKNKKIIIYHAWQAGEEIPCFALTAPEAGSDAGSIPDTGIVCRASIMAKKSWHSPKLG